MPFAVLTLVEAVRGVQSALVPTAPSVIGRAGIAAAALITSLLALTAAGPIGSLAARLAPRLLGPTSRDRLDVALARIAQETEHRRIARELHDGIGHALTIVSIQAAAGGRVIDRDSAAAAQALARIESTAREALVELDQVLADLRAEGIDRTGTIGRADGAGPTEGPDEAEPTEGPDGAGPTKEKPTEKPAGAGPTEVPDGARPAPAPAEQGPTRAPEALSIADISLEARLDHVLAGHRRVGMDLRGNLDVPGNLPPAQHEHLLRIVTEMLTNALRHGGPGPVHLHLEQRRESTGERATVIACENPCPTATAHTSVGGRGLVGLRERLDLWGGTLEAGPVGSATDPAGSGAETWRTRAVLPLLPERLDR
nr:histidine kinase [Brachybacterium sacelli]